MQTWNALTYHQSSHWQQKLNKEFILTHPYIGSEDVLDIGCGTGSLAYQISEKVPMGSVVGIDTSEDMINYASKNFSNKNLCFIKMDAENLSLEKKFDVIISTFCIHWLVNKKDFFKRITSNLKNNGFIYFIAPFDNPVLTAIRKSLMHHSHWSCFFEKKSDLQDRVLDANYRDYAVLAGFDNIEFDVESTNIIFENTFQLAAILKNVTMCVSYLPTEQLKTRFIEEFIQNYLKTNPLNPGGTCEVNCTYVKLKAQYHY